MAPDGPRDAVSVHLAALGASARPTGGAAAAAGRAYCRAVLERAGFAVKEHTFTYSRVAGAAAAPAAGLFAALVAGGLFLGRDSRLAAVAAVAVLIVAGTVLGYVGNGGVLNLPAGRRDGVNLVATRGADEPRVWLVAHVDSKWQPVSMIARVLGVIGTTAGLGGLVAVTLISPGAHERLAVAFLAIAWLGAAPLLLSVVGARNHGTLDNASGVAAVLEAIDAVPSSSRVGVLITDAEELALAGARAWARERRERIADVAPVIALNCDSVDDCGEITVIYGRPAPVALVAAIRRNSAAAGEPLRAMRLIPGILTDHVALARAGWQTVTLSRGNARTLARIHTSRDTLEFMRGTGIAGAASILARTAREFG